MKRISQPFPVWKCILVISFVAVYTCVLPQGFITIDPCSSTPGYDNIVGYTLLCLFPFLLGGLLYFLFSHSVRFRIKSFLKSLALAFVWLFLAFVLWFFENGLLFSMDHSLMNHLPSPFIQYDCHELFLEPSILLLCLLYIIDMILVGWLVYLITKRKTQKTKPPKGRRP